MCRRYNIVIGAMAHLTHHGFVRTLQPPFVITDVSADVIRQTSSRADGMIRHTTGIEAIDVGIDVVVAHPVVVGVNVTR